MLKKTKSLLVVFLLFFSLLFSVSTYSLTVNAEENVPLHNLTIVDGVASVNEVNVDQVAEGTLVTIVANEKENHRFERWEVVSGENVIFNDENNSTTTFDMPACDVEILAVYTNLVLDEIIINLTNPIPGEYYDNSITSSEPELYTVTLTQIQHSKSFNNIGTNLTPIFDTNNPYEAGVFYGYFFSIELHDDRIMPSIDKIFVNGNRVYLQQSTGYYYAIMETDYPINVINCSAFADEECTTPISYIKYGESFYVKAELETVDGVFSHWSVSPNAATEVKTKNVMRVNQLHNVLTVTANYINKHTITVNGGHTDPPKALGGTTITVWLDYVPEGGVFSHWLLNGEKIELVNDTFTMPDEDVVLDAVYHIHTYNNTLKYDEDGHFYECTYGDDCVDLLHSRKNVVPHTFGYICDMDCNDNCGYVRAVTHDFSEDWVADANEHWHVCNTEECKTNSDKQKHVFDNGVCEICNYACLHTEGKHICDYCGLEISTCIDANTDHICDICNQGGIGVHEQAEGKHTCDYCGVEISTCIDANTDHICDICNQGGIGVHEQAEGKHTCDYCGVEISTCIDANTDHICDICNQGGIGVHEQAVGKHTCDYCGAEISTCVDANTDHICDICNQGGIGVHEQAQGKHTCDYCGVEISTCVDANTDHICDICNQGGIGVHEQAVGKHTCDYCGVEISTCVDANTDHICDICNQGGIGVHEQAEGKHTCDYCGVEISTCVDANTDHICDICNQGGIGVHEQAQGKHTCDYCGVEISTCVDANTDHICDICNQGGIGVHEQAVGKHICDYCGVEISTCVDANTDHICDICNQGGIGVHEQAVGKHTCDYCGAEISTCVDANTDHICDICNQGGIGVHEQAVGKHTCDYCGVEISTCVDANTDHNCDICGKTLSSHTDTNKDSKCDYCGSEMPRIKKSGCNSSIANGIVPMYAFIALGLIVFLRKKR